MRTMVISAAPAWPSIFPENSPMKKLLAGSPTPKVVRKFCEDTSNAKTNAFNQTAEVACRSNAPSASIKFLAAIALKGTYATVGN